MILNVVWAFPVKLEVTVTRSCALNVVLETDQERGGFLTFFISKVDKVDLV